jgi:hypothetical protein
MAFSDKPKKSNYSSLKSLLAQSQQRAPYNPYINHEFQDYGYELAKKLNDLDHKALYMKLAKTYPRTLLDNVYSFVSDYPNAKNKGKIFMWKLKQIREKSEETKKETNPLF